MALAVRLTANITAGHLLIHLIGGATLVLINISPPTATITFIILLLLTILEFAVALIQARRSVALLATTSWLAVTKVKWRTRLSPQGRPPRRLRPTGPHTAQCSLRGPRPLSGTTDHGPPTVGQFPGLPLHTPLA